MKHEKMGNIKLDKRNYRVHSQKNKDLIKKSLTELGAGRSVVIDSEDTLVAGNGVFEQAQKIGMPTKIIETDGTELIVVKRTDLKTDDEKRKKLALADNSISDTSEFDFDVMANDFMIEDLAEWGVNIGFDEDEEPTDLDSEPENKPFIVKLTFENPQDIDKFMKAYADNLRADYRCIISIGCMSD